MLFFISDHDDILKRKVNKFITDPNRVYRTQKGNPEICNVWSLHKIYNLEEKDKIKFLCENAKIDCTTCKEKLFIKINNENKNITKKIRTIENNDEYINNIIKDGVEKTRVEAIKNLNKLKNIFNI
ncbi:MAG TPA: tryptophan--tRNA ligase [Candidatus Azoamicus sp.]